MTTINAFICEGSEFTIPIIVWKGEPSQFVDLCSKKQGWTVLFAPDCNAPKESLQKRQEGTTIFDNLIRIKMFQ